MVFSEDSGKTWNFMNEGLGNRNVLCLAVSENYLYAGTEEGIWRYLIPTGIQKASSPAHKITLKIGKCFTYLIPDELINIRVRDAAGRNLKNGYKCQVKGNKVFLEFKKRGVYFVEITLRHTKTTWKVVSIY